MNLLSLAERIAELDVAPIRLNADRCLHARSKFSNCEVCVDACPISALQLNGSIALKTEACVVCGQCLHVCPTGAFDGDDGLIDLLKCVARLEPDRTIELACSRHPAPEKGPTETTDIIRISTCLAALGPAAYLALLALDVKRVAVRLDACASCPLGKVQAGIEHTLSIVQQLLKPFGIADRIVGLTTIVDQSIRPIYETKNPVVSRRDLFRALVAKGPQRIARPVIDVDDQSVVAKSPSRERRRLINVVKQLDLIDSNVTLQDLAFAKLTADEHCTACGTCARICPTGALNFNTSVDAQYQLTFSSQACIDCGMCLDICQLEALHCADATLADVLKDQSVVLRAGEFRSCKKCGAKFAAEASSDLCPICDFRRSNPMGRYLPPILKKRNTGSAATVKVLQNK